MLQLLKIWMRRHRRSILSVGLAWTLLGCSSEPDVATPPPPRNNGGDVLPKARLALNWFPESEHGGYYHAQLKGLYRKAGVDIEIIKGGPGSGVEIEVGTGRAAFGIVNADKILSTRLEGVPLVALMAPFQRSPRCIIVRDSSPVKELSQLKDLTLIANPTKSFLKFLQWKYGLDGVKVVPYKGGLATFLNDENAAVQGYITSEPLVLRRKGLGVRAMAVSDVGFNPYTSVLVCSEQLVEDKPDMVRAVVKASQQGWLEYLSNPELANKEIHRLNPEMDLETLAYGAEQLKALMLTEEAADGVFGTMTTARWTTLKSQLTDCGSIKKSDLDVSVLFTTKYLQ